MHIGDDHSLDAQSNNIESYVEDQTWSLVRIYTDANKSAKKGSQRAGLVQLMRDAEAGEFDVVVVDKIDRFYRYLNGLLTALDKLNTWEVSFASVHEKLDFTTPWGKLMLTVLGMLAELYIDNLRRETRKGNLQRARDGFWNGNIPFGYCRGLCSQCENPNGKGYCPDYGQDDKSGDEVLIPHPIESHVVKKVFEWYLSGEHSDSTIASRLNESHYQLPDGSMIPFRHKGAPGRTQPGKFRKNYIRGVLKRIFYTGKVPYYGKAKNGTSRRRKTPLLFPGQHPAIIDEDAFDEVQEMRSVLAPVPRNRCSARPRVYPLTGTLFCGYCGGRFRGSTGSSNGKRRYYRDSNQLEQVVDCPQSLVRTYDIEDQVTAYFRDVVTSSKLNDTLEAAEAQLEKADTRLQRAKTLYLSGDIDKAAYQKEKHRYELVQKSLQALDHGAIIASIRKIHRQLDGWRDLPKIKKKRPFRLALERAYLRGDTLIVAVASLKGMVVTAPSA